MGARRHCEQGKGAHACISVEREEVGGGGRGGDGHCLDLAIETQKEEVWGE